MDRAAGIGCVAGAVTALAVSVAIVAGHGPDEPKPWPFTPRYGPSSPDPLPPRQLGSPPVTGDDLMLLPPASGPATIERWAP